MPGANQFLEEYGLMRRTIIMIAALTFSLALFLPLTSAKTIANGAVARTTAQEMSPEEAAAYKAWFDENQKASQTKDYKKAMELAKAYLEKYPNGKKENVAYFKDKWMPGVFPILFNQAVAEKNVSEIIRIGKEVLGGNPDNLDFLWAMVVQIRTLELGANPANYSHGADAVEYSDRAIKLMDAGKTLTGGDASKKNVTQAYLHQTVAIVVEHDKNVDKALAEYDKAGQLDPSNASFFFHCGRIHNDKYAASAQKYEVVQKKSEAATKKSDDLQAKLKAVPEADRTAGTKPEVKALIADAKTAQDEAKVAQDEEKVLLAEVNGQADAVITCWARFLGLTVDKNPWGATRDQIQKAFTDLYKYRHNDSTDGLQKLIDQNKPSASASNGDAAASSSVSKQ